mmetsp:Transcript_44678/g.103234  ORF Transcript_44678/g.103234 Transcript_44678/m.103234 type:complete len:330 (-) Transcript_44678:60-1049(-)
MSLSDMSMMTEHIPSQDVEAVACALRNSPLLAGACQDMMVGIVPYIVGVPGKDHDKFQSKMLACMRGVLQSEEAELCQRLQEIQQQADPVIEIHTSAEADRDAKAQRVQAAEEALLSFEQVHSQGLKQVRDAAAVLDQEEAARCKISAELIAMQVEKEMCAMTNALLEQGKELLNQRLLAATLCASQKMQLEQSLLMALPTALPKLPGERSKLEAIAIAMYLKALGKHIQHLELELIAKTARLHERADAVHVARCALEHEQRAALELRGNLGSAQSMCEAAKAELSAAEVLEAKTSLQANEARRSLHDAEQALNLLRDGPLKVLAACGA